MKRHLPILAALSGILLLAACGDRTFEKSSFKEANLHVLKGSAYLMLKNISALDGRNAMVYFNNEAFLGGPIVIKVDVSLESKTVVVSGTPAIAYQVLERSFVVLGSVTIFVSSAEEKINWEQRFREALVKYGQLNKKTVGTPKKVDPPPIFCSGCGL